MKFGKCSICFKYTRLRDGKNCKKCIRESNKIVLYEILDKETIETLKKVKINYNGYLPMSPNPNYSNLFEEIIDIYNSDKKHTKVFKQSLDEILHILRKQKKKQTRNKFRIEKTVDKLEKKKPS